MIGFAVRATWMSTAKSTCATNTRSTSSRRQIRAIRPLLREIPDPPGVLFRRGDWPSRQTS